MSFRIFLALPLIFLGLTFSMLSRTHAATGARTCERLFASATSVSATKIEPVRVGMAQINGRVGDFAGNLRKLVRYTRKAAAEGVQILVFPEMAFSSYPVRDLIERRDFLEESEKALERYLKEIAKIQNVPETIFVGSITRNPKTRGHEAQNSVIVIHNGQIAYTQAKQLLPNYDVYDELRNFAPGKAKKPWKSPYGKVACAVCEDFWAASLVNGRYIYGKDPAEQMVGANFAVNVSASPYYRGKPEYRQEVIGSFARRIQAPIIYVNQVGAHDEIIFDGASTVYGSEGQALYSFRSFAEGLATFNFASVDGKETVTQVSEWLSEDAVKWRRPDGKIQDTSEIASIHQAIVLAIRDYFKKTGFEKAVLGLSGGIDSAVTATMLVDALGKENVLGVLMPGPYSSPGSITDAAELAANLGIRTVIAPITELTGDVLANVRASTDELAKEWDSPDDEASEDNVQARLRMINVMYFANKFRMLAIATSNKSELSVGQTTAHGDTAGAMAPIGDLFKTIVYELAHYLNGVAWRIPQGSLTKAPSGELGPNQTDEAKFGPFKILDPVLAGFMEEGLPARDIAKRGFKLRYVESTIRSFEKSEFKRRGLSVVPKVTPKAIGPGRRIPISKVPPK